MLGAPRYFSWSGGSGDQQVYDIANNGASVLICGQVSGRAFVLNLCYNYYNISDNGNTQYKIELSKVSDAHWRFRFASNTGIFNIIGMCNITKTNKGSEVYNEI